MHKDQPRFTMQSVVWRGCRHRRDDDRSLGFARDDTLRAWLMKSVLFAAVRRLVLLAFALSALRCAAPAPPPQVTPDRPAAAADERVIGSVRVTATALNVRKDPSTTADILIQVRKGAQLQLLSENESWSKVKLASGEIGWVASQHVARAGSKPSANPKRRGSCPPDSDFAFVKTPLASFTEGGPHGLVVVEANVSAKGDVTSTRLISNSTGEAGMATIAEKEIRATKFAPPVRDCATRSFIFTYKRSF